jgi:FG-GAP repeat
MHVLSVVVVPVCAAKGAGDDATDSPDRCAVAAGGRRDNNQPRGSPADRVGPLGRGGDFNHDGVADLAVGVPGENDIAGAVDVLYGAGAGLGGTGAQFFQVGGTPEFLDRFGSALAAGDFNGDGFADLAAGASGEDVGSVRDAGAVSVLYGSAGGLTRSGGPAVHSGRQQGRGAGLLRLGAGRRRFQP